MKRVEKVVGQVVLLVLCIPLFVALALYLKVWGVI